MIKSSNLAKGTDTPMHVPGAAAGAVPVTGLEVVVWRPRMCPVFPVLPGPGVPVCETGSQHERTVGPPQPRCA